MHAQTNDVAGEIVEAEVIHAQPAQAIVPRPVMSEDSSPAGMIAYAMRSNASVAELRELYAFKKEYDADEARKAYVAAMAQFKSEPLTIVKDKHVSYTTAKGTTEYDHATIGNVTTQICAALGRHGFSHRWNTDQQDGGRIVVTCVITHSRGHFESTTLKASPDDSGGKNNIQAIASAVTYLQRYTLLAATGMATSDQEDDDGCRAAVDCITEEQAAILRGMLEATGSNEAKFLEWLKVESLTAIPAKRFDEALTQLKRKEKSK
jgi:hypothetical protein